jgi:hypothetical protein
MYFFIEFQEGVEELDLWVEFARFGRVEEVYIPKKN